MSQRNWQKLKGSNSGGAWWYDFWSFKATNAGAITRRRKVQTSDRHLHERKASSFVISGLVTLSNTPDITKA